MKTKCIRGIILGKLYTAQFFLGKSVSTKMEPWLAQATIFQIMKLNTFYADDFNVL